MSDPDALNRLMREAIPSGKFGGPPPAPTGPTTPQVAALHLAELQAAIDAHDRAVRDGTAPATPRHLIAVRDTDPAPHVDPRTEQRPA